MKHSQKQIQEAKAAAQRLYKKVNFDGGNLQSYQLSSLMQQTYDFLKIPFKPNTNDVKEYSKVLDANKDGQVSLKDLEQMAINFLCGESILNTIITKKQTSYQQNQNNFQTANTSNNKFGQNNLQNNQFSGNNIQYGKLVNNAQDQSFNLTFADNRNFKQTLENATSKQQNQPAHEETYLKTSPVKSKYTDNALQYLNITRSLFNKYCNKQSHTITRDKVGPLLVETYGSLGRKGYHPSEEDVNVWMKLCDTNNDGHVEEAEYQYFVIRALERSGIQPYNQ